MQFLFLSKLIIRVIFKSLSLIRRGKFSHIYLSLPVNTFSYSKRILSAFNAVENIGRLFFPTQLYTIDRSALFSPSEKTGNRFEITVAACDDKGINVWPWEICPRDGDAEDTTRRAARLLARGRINLPEIANSFQHSLKEGRWREEKAFSEARASSFSSSSSFCPPPAPSTWRRFLSSLHLRPVHLASPVLFASFSCARLTSFRSFYLCLYTARSFYLALILRHDATRCSREEFALVLFGA